jgi:hypothetical protein
MKYSTIRTSNNDEKYGTFLSQSPRFSKQSSAQKNTLSRQISNNYDRNTKKM